MLRNLASAIFAMLPHFVADRVHPYRRRLYRECGVTPVRAAKRRLLIGPVNSAGQAHAWARAAELLSGVTAVNVMFRGDVDVFGFPADHEVPSTFATGCQRWQNAQRKSILRSFTHVIVESGQPLFNTRRPVIEHLNTMRAGGVSPALLFHGSDIRSPKKHAAQEPESPFQDSTNSDIQTLEHNAEVNQELIAKAGMPVFVSTPDLLQFVPGATWLPVVVEPLPWASAASQPALNRVKPVVVHAPSRAGLKGSDLIAATVRALHDEGVIEYREAHGVPAEKMPRFYGDADVVLDQFSLGIYGVAACEAMASGRLVVSHVGVGVRNAVEESTGFSLPIVESTARDLESVLRQIARAPAYFQEVALSGPQFVSAVHDGRRSAEILGTFLDAGTSVAS